MRANGVSEMNLSLVAGMAMPAIPTEKNTARRSFAVNALSDSIFLMAVFMCLV
jgi:hypothetical protein